ncbi:hypothetical protein FXO38_34248 [Capsicum annuum]|nr:hypothetical protein FXO38_34248 [Capsicum annuum]
MDSEELPEQSQSGKSKAEESYKNNVEVVHSWIVPTEQELVVTFFITLGLIDTIADPMVELIKKEFSRAIAIRREVRQGQPNVQALHDQPTAIDLGASYGVLLVDQVEAILMLLPFMMISMLMFKIK